MKEDYNERGNKLEDTDSLYIIDANAFITPYKHYYRFSIAPSFWEQFNDNAEKRLIYSIDKVKEEICVSKEEESKDQLQKWIEDEYKGSFITTKSIEIISEYQNIINFMNESPKYNDKALKAWSDFKIADPWIIATAKIFNSTIVTFETANNNGVKEISKPKIPDLCKDFNIRCKDLFEMMDELGFRF